MNELIKEFAKEPAFLAIAVEGDPIVKRAISVRNTDLELSKPTEFKKSMLQLQQSVQEEVEKFKHNVNKRATEAQTQCGHILNDLQTQNDTIENNPHHSHLGKVVDDLKHKIRGENVDVRAAGEGVFARLLTAKGAFKDFQNKHNQHNEPRKPKNLVVTIALMIALVGLEIAINSFFFDDLSNQGLIGAAFEAILFAPFNVLSASIIGYYSLRYIHHVDRGKRIFAFVVGVALAAFVLFLNSYLAALRLSLKEGNFYDIPELLGLIYSSRILEVMDYKALGITILGLTLAGVACWKAYTLKDPYPGYDEVYRKKRNAEYDVDDLRDEYLNNVKDFGDDAKQELVGRFHEIIQEIINFRAFIDFIKAEKKRYDSINSSIEKAFTSRQHKFHQDYISRIELQTPKLQEIMAEYDIDTQCSDTDATLEDIPESQVKTVSEIEAKIRNHFNILEEDIAEIVSSTGEASESLFESMSLRAVPGG